MAKIAPSILACDFARLGEEISDVCSKGIDFLHIDVMDGAFVPNISFGASVMKSLNSYASVPYDVHLMIEDPDRYIEDFVTDNTEFITVHQEACRHLDRTVAHIKDTGCKAGVSINPATPVCLLRDILDKIDLVLVMSVNPGFGGQKFIPNALNKIRELDKIRKEQGLSFAIEVDGGAGEANSAALRDAGCDIIVAGTAVFKAEDRAKAISVIKG
ncbi:MAG: ribulose-phosphate 3-epimerase [Firmicutes bacterium]|nr:ribulose-phosphate 3-epimerase [Bacillota bacterium]